MKRRLVCNTQYIDSYLQEHNISKKEFDKRCGIDMKVLKQLYKQNGKVDSAYIIPIVKVLNISANTFLFMEKFHTQKGSYV